MLSKWKCCDSKNIIKAEGSTPENQGFFFEVHFFVAPLDFGLSLLAMVSLIISEDITGHLSITPMRSKEIQRGNV